MGVIEKVRPRDATALKADAVNDEMKRSNSTLVDEMKRGSGDKQ